MMLRSSPDTLEALHVGPVRESLSREARTGPGRRLCLDLAPLADLEAARARFSRLVAWGQAIEREGRGVPSGLPDPAPAAARLAIGGFVLEATEVRALAVSLSASDALGRRLRAFDAEAFPELAAEGAASP